jgi:hypothetical protein
MGPKALTFIHSLARKSLTKGQGSGITKIPSAMQAEAKASEIFTNLVEAGLKPEMMDDFIRSEADVAKYLNILDAYKRERMKPIPADSPRGREITEALFGKRGTVVDMKGNVIPEGSGIMGGESIESLMKSGDVTKGTVTKKSKKVTDRDMFKAANERLGKPKTDVNTIIKNINSMDPIEAMKEANKVIKREGPYKNLNQQQAKKILEDTEDHIFERDVTPMDEDFAAGGVAGLLGERTGYAQGTDVFRRQKKEIPEEIKKKIFEMIMGTRNLGKVIENSERTKSRIGSEGVKAYGLAEGGRTGYKEGLTAKQFKRQETENLAAKINEYFDIKGSGSKSGKNQIMGAPDGITADTETFNAIINMDIPIKEKINLLGSFGFGKDRFKVEKGDEELFLGEGGYKDRNIGLGFNQGGEGLSGSVIRNLETGDNDYQVKFLKKFASGGRVGLRYGGDTMGGINDKSISSPGPDRFKVSEQQELNNQEAISRARDSQQYDYTVPKQIVKDIAINTGKNLAGQKIASTLGIGATPIGIFMALKGLYDQTQNPVYSEEDLTYGVPYQTGGRVGLAGGMTRRAFLKLMGGVAAGIGAIKSGIMGVGKKGVAKKVVKEVIKTPPVAGKPEWFDALINKVILEGDDVTKKLATKDREIVHTKKLNDQESVTVTQDLDDGAIRVEYDSPDNLGQEPVMMQFKPGMADETTGGKKPADRFDVVETEPRYTGPDNTDIEFIGESGGPNISFIESDVTNLKTFATGKGPTMKEIVKSKKRKDLTRAVNENDYEAAEYLGGKYGDAPEPDFPDDYSGYASGGIAGMLGE